MTNEHANTMPSTEESFFGPDDRRPFFEQGIIAVCLKCGAKYNYPQWIGERHVTRDMAELILSAEAPLPAGPLVGRVRTCRDDIAPAYIGDDAYTYGCGDCGQRDGREFRLFAGESPVLLEGNFLRLLLMLNSETATPRGDSPAAIPLRFVYEKTWTWQSPPREERELVPLWRERTAEAENTRRGRRDDNPDPFPMEDE